jgi:short subunit dehydrogenase-like uncharacterized protein
MKQIVVFGATGYTGRLVVAALAGRGLRPVLAGRSQQRLRELSERYGGLDTAIADVTQPHSVRALVEDGDVLVSTVGPFLRYGEPALEAAVAAGAHYVDCTGEAGFVRRVFGEYGRRAQDADCVLLTAFGYDFVPGNLAGALAARAAGGQASRVEIGYFTAGDPRRGLSSGTRATMATGMGQQVHALVGGQLVLAPFARRVRVFADGGRRRPAGLFGGTEPLALPRVAPALTDVAVFLGWFAGATRLLQVGSYVLPLLVRTPGIAAVLRRRGEQALARTGQGPDEQQRSAAAGESIIIAVAADRGGRELASVRLRGINGYDLTGRLLAWAAAHLAAGRVTMAGALGPVDAFGVEALEAACREAGLSRD